MTLYGEIQPTMREQKRRFKQWIVGTTCRVLLMGMLVVFGVLYVVQVSAISAKGYDLADLQKQINALEHENEKLLVDIAKHQSMASIEDRLPALGLVAAADAEYLNTPGAIVARR